jgi:hypothetical protein
MLKKRTSVDDKIRSSLVATSVIILLNLYKMISEQERPLQYSIEISLMSEDQNEARKRSRFECSDPSHRSLRLCNQSKERFSY